MKTLMREVCWQRRNTGECNHSCLWKKMSEKQWKSVSETTVARYLFTSNPKELSASSPPVLTDVGSRENHRRKTQTQTEWTSGFPLLTNFTVPSNTRLYWSSIFKNDMSALPSPHKAKAIIFHIFYTLKFS